MNQFPPNLWVVRRHRWQFAAGVVDKNSRDPFPLITYIFVVCSRQVFKVYVRVTNFFSRILAWLAIFLNFCIPKLQFSKLLRIFLPTYKLIFNLLQMEPRRPILTALTLVAFTSAARGHLLKGRVSRYENFFEALNILISTFRISADCFQCLSKLFTTL